MNTEQELAIEVEMNDLMTETVERMIAGLDELGKENDELKAQLAKLERLADCSSTQAFLALSDGDKARWFSTTGQRDRWARERIEQLEVVLSDALRQLGRWENGYAYDAHGEERNVERRIRAALAQPKEVGHD